MHQPLPCPLLPAALPHMSYRNLRTAAPASLNDTAGHLQFFHTCLQYGQYLWLQQLPARAILALCRAIYLPPQPLLKAAPCQPYCAITWLYLHPQKDAFLGNPRVSFFHQATRIAAHRQLQRQRAWALWFLTVSCLPQLPADPDEAACALPGKTDILNDLQQMGLPGEAETWALSLPSG
jgi:hypothetical protein